MIERIKEGANSMNPFYEEVYAGAADPFGKVVSYSQIAWNWDKSTAREQSVERCA